MKVKLSLSLVILFVFTLSLMSCQRWKKNIAEADFQKNQPQYETQVKYHHPEINKQ